MTQENSAEWAALKACGTPLLNPEQLRKSVERVDWRALLDLAEEHGVTQLAAARLNRILSDAAGGVSEREENSPELGGGELSDLEVEIPKTNSTLSSVNASAGWRATLTEILRAQAFFTLRMSAELFRLEERFAASGIEMMTVKGPALAVQAYGDAAMRKYGDLDFVMRDRDIAAATQLMMDAGYAAEIPLSTIAAGKIPGQYMFRQAATKLLVELHSERTMRYYPRRLPLEKLFARRARVNIEGRTVPAPSAEDHLVIICVHGAKHFWEKLLWIADVAALISRTTEMRWALVEESARDVGAETMLHGGLLLAAGILQTPLPAEVLQRARADGAARAMTRQVLEWLPQAGEARPEFQRGLLRRAFFRMRMRGGAFAGVGYFLRLLFSPTEEDWGEAGDGRRGIA
ncbi:MAG TPA: nucleotidyltransferase family protein, partial [Candidatus Dormibacteraeota bacterium]|nr:nucleotidyltransferase family protein [Candidatus Dormibacteraeota bacterium]